MPSTTRSTSYSLDGNRRSISSYCAELRRVGAEQLREAVIDLEVRDAEDRQSGEQSDESGGDVGCLERIQAQAIEPERK